MFIGKYYRSFATSDNNYTIPGVGTFDITKLPSGAQRDLYYSKYPNTASGEAVQFGSTSKGDPKAPYSKDSSGNPIVTKSPSGCDNCKYGDTWCEFMKMGCEAKNSSQLPLIIVGGLALVLLVSVIR